MGNEQQGAQIPTEEWGQLADVGWSDFDFTPHEHLIEVDGRNINYIDLGGADKPVLLFVHGLMGTWTNWIFNLLPFVDRYRVIAVDLPGFGKSEMPAGELTVEGYADALRKLCSQLGIDRVTLIGNSMGGQVGWIVGKKFPEFVEKLFLVDAAGICTSNRYLRRVAPYAWMLNWFFALGLIARNVIARSRVLRTIFLKFVLHRPAMLTAELALLLIEGAGKKGFVPAVRSITTTPIYRFPGGVQAPTVIVWGRNDVFLPKSDAFRFAKFIPQAEVELMDEVGHIPMFETPERFNALVEHHLAAGGPGTPGPVTPTEPAAA